jgi:hypothetical protein
MRVVTWNCCKGLHKKWAPVAGWNPDILVVQEAACPEVLRAKGVPLPDQVQWVGSDKNCGLLVAAFRDYRLRVAETYFASLQWVLPLVVSGPETFTLLAVCDMYTMTSQGDPDAAASDAVTVALSRYQEQLARGDVVLVGDLNNNVVFDLERGTRNFRPTVEALTGLGYVSAYHAHRGEEHGRETAPTHYNLRREHSPHHIDYCFLPADWRIDDLCIGGYEEWVSRAAKWRSDHTPLITDVSPR